MSAYFVTATGTGIGKTFATCALVHAARAAKKHVAALKPVISGYGLGFEDSAAIIEALGGDVALDAISPWRFEAALSPDMAAELEGRQLTLDEVVAWSGQQIEQNELTFVEGVGGVMVPLNAQHTVRDWIAALDIPAILVTGSYLGSLSHTLTAYGALQQVGVSVKAVIVSESCETSVPLAATERSLRAHIGAKPLLVTQPLVSSYHEAHAIHALLKELA
jgi:dethiobiotin synthetase